MHTLSDLIADRFYLDKEEVKRITQILKIKTSDLAIKLLPFAAKRAHPTISNYRVGVVGTTKSGSILFGCNLEASGLPLNNSLHAEQFLVISSLLRKEELVSLTVSAEPCGHCRQFLNEIKGGSKLSIVVPGIKATKLKDLLPASFGPSNLKINISLYDERHNNLVLKTATSDATVQEALRQANNAYAPYSSCPSGIAVSLKNGKVFGGFYIENAAFNPSVSPILSALVNLISNGYDYNDIKDVVLVERKKGPVSQENNVKDVISSIAPSTTFKSHEAIWSLMP